MTVRRLRRLCPILLAIVLTCTIERPSCAQVDGQASQPSRSPVPLEPPLARPGSTPASGSSSPKAASVRIVLEMAPPAKKPAAAQPAPAPTTAAQPSPGQLSAPKPSALRPVVTDLAAPKSTGKQLLELNAPPSSTPARLAAAKELPARDSLLPAPVPNQASAGQASAGQASADQAGAGQAGVAKPGRAALELPVLSAPSRVGPARAPSARGETAFEVAAPEEIPAPWPAAPDRAPAPVAVTQEVETSNRNVGDQTPAAEQTMPGTSPSVSTPGGTETVESALAEPYWVRDVLRLSASGEPDLQPIGFDQAIWDALAHSPYVKAVLTVPQISQAKISEASGIFDQTPFVDSIFNDTSDPVGSTLTTGGPSRLNETRMDNAVGVRAKNALGGTAELAQNMQLRNNNSVFLSPKQQADAKMLLRLNQPLMRGAGSTYTTSSLRIAEFNAGVTQHEAMRKLQLHAEAIATAYWNLFAARAIEMQAERGTERLVYLRDELAKRAEVDGLRSQLLRAEAAIARQSSTKARAQADVASAEASLRALVNSPALADGPPVLMPATPPIDEPFVIDRTSELQAALAFHPDLLAARDRIKAATTRLKVAENELRPTLNLVMEGYLHGLNGAYGLGDSMVDQFSSGRPSYSGGLNYQRPYRNIVSKAILRERRLELRQLLLDLDNSLLTVTAEVVQAIAAVNFTYAELEASVKSTIAFDSEVRYLDGRWKNVFVETTQPSLLLDELLNAQNQLIQAENSWARAQAEHMIAFAKLHVATGTLLNSVPIPFGE